MLYFGNVFAVVHLQCLVLVCCLALQLAKCHENWHISNGEVVTIATVGFSCDRDGGNTRIFIGGYSPRGLEDGSPQCGPGTKP